MRKQIVILLAAMTLAAASASAQYQGAGTICASRQGSTVKVWTQVPPTQLYLQQCRIEVTWRDAAGARYQWTPCDCMATVTVPLPQAAQQAQGFQVAKRLFWQPPQGTVWKLTNGVPFTN
jgi:hypothetical protein